MPGALQGIRILDISTALTGPYPAALLADQGADVIKVEPPSGEMTRRSTTGIMDMTNRNKRAIVLDLKTADGVRELQNRRVEITYGPGSGQ